jgi:hypothetical protein
MPLHQWNALGFNSSRNGPIADFVNLYLGLVELELSCKSKNCVALDATNKFANWVGTHDVKSLIRKIVNNHAQAALLNSLVTQLETALFRLTVTARDGSSTQLVLQAYPGLRYLRHQSEFAGLPSSNDEDIISSIDKLSRLRTALKKAKLV